MEGYSLVLFLFCKLEFVVHTPGESRRESRGQIIDSWCLQYIVLPAPISDKPDVTSICVQLKAGSDNPWMDHG